MDRTLKIEDLKNEYSNIFDTHSHYDDKRFLDDSHEIIRNFHKYGIIGAVNIGATMDSSRSSVELAKKYENIYATVGVHPHDSDTMVKNNIEELRTLARSNKVVAIGEIGLDYYYDNSKRENQLRWFHEQMALAQSLNLPVVIHSREATLDTINVLKQYKVSAVNHSFSGSVETAEILLEMGNYLGFTGVVTFKNAKKAVEVAKMVPIDRFLIETDAPYMAPSPFRGMRSDSRMLYRVAEIIGEIKNLPTQNIIDQGKKNAYVFYRIIK